MLVPSPFSASSSLSILRSAKLSRTPPVGLIGAVCLCEAAGALRAAGARHCQWTESLTLPGSPLTRRTIPTPLVIVFTLTPPPLPEFMCAFLPSSVSFLSSLSLLLFLSVSFPAPLQSSSFSLPTTHQPPALTQREKDSGIGSQYPTKRAWMMFQFKGSEDRQVE